LPFFCLAVAVVLQDGHGVAVDTDYPGPAALGGSFHALAANHSGGTAERDLGGVQVDGMPAARTTSMDAKSSSAMRD
jgi:CO dehydrogenase/acetyl-CoA synthase beta subunit